MARRPTNPARRKRRTAVCAVLLPLLLAALLLVLDFPFLTAQGALAATQERYAFGPGEVIARFSPQQEGMPPLRYYIVRDGDWFAWCSVERDGLFWRPGALTAACPDGEAPLAILASPAFGGRGQELTVVSGGPDVVAVEVDYLFGFDLPRLARDRPPGGAGRSVLFLHPGGSLPWPPPKCLSLCLLPRPVL